MWGGDLHCMKFYVLYLSGDCVCTYSRCEYHRVESDGAVRPKCGAAGNSLWCKNQLDFPLPWFCCACHLIPMFHVAHSMWCGVVWLQEAWPQVDVAQLLMRHPRALLMSPEQILDDAVKVSSTAHAGLTPYTSCTQHTYGTGVCSSVAVLCNAVIGAQHRRAASTCRGRSETKPHVLQAPTRDGPSAWLTCVSSSYTTATMHCVRHTQHAVRKSSSDL